MSNVRKHAHGTRVDVRACCRDGVLEVSISDDGRGTTTGTTLGFGLKTMAERAQALGGSLVVRSHPGAGTIVTVRLPESRGTDDARAGG
jgi:signal transduction histidine kinase